MKKILLLLAVLTVLIYSCSKDNPVTTQTNNEPVYHKVLSVNKDNARVEMWSATDTILYYGYNDIGFKIFINGAEQTSGFVRFNPRMVHVIGYYGHGTPVKPEFYYDNNKKLFSGYASFIMVSDSTENWRAGYEYNNTILIEDSIFYVYPNSSHKIVSWPNIPDEHIYYISLISPYKPSAGLNDYSFIINRSKNDTLFSEVDSCGIFIRTLLESSGRNSNNNTNPVWTGGGKYKGIINLDASGLWDVYDSVKYNNVIITNNPSPKILFQVL